MVKFLHVCCDHGFLHSVTPQLRVTTENTEGEGGLTPEFGGQYIIEIN